MGKRPMTSSRYFNKYTIRNDLMHCQDHHGVWAVIFASIVWFLCINNGQPSLGDTQQARLDTVNRRLARHYAKNKGISSTLDPLTFRNIIPAGTASYATLAGPTVKAANTRHAMPFLKVLADKHLTDANDMDHVLMHMLIGHCLEFNRIIGAAGTFLTEAEVAGLREATEGVGKYIQLLRSRAKEAKQLLWHIVPKSHYMQHFPDEARLINPRLVQCYIEESYIGKVSKIWASCKCGPYSETIQHRGLLKYLVWLCIELDL